MHEITEIILEKQTGIFILRKVRSHHSYINTINLSNFFLKIHKLQRFIKFIIIHSVLKLMAMNKGWERIKLLKL